MDSEAFGEAFYDHTTLDPVGLAAVVLLGITLVLIPRRYSVWPMIVMACFIAPAQRIAIFSLNFDLLRIMVVFGLVRIILKQEWRGFTLHSLDYCMLVWTASGAIIYVMLYGTLDAVKYKLGDVYDAAGMYFLFRLLIRDWGDIDTLGMGVIAMSVPVALAFLEEHATGRNLFASLGGVPAITVIREGRLRCQGAFAHPILAGCFWAASIPLMAARWSRGRNARIAMMVGIAAAVLIIILCASSTPVMGALCAVIGIAVFSLRRRMQWVRWGLLACVVGLHLVMKPPVWNLIARIDLAGGSTGYHRYELINESINHFGEWWLMGTKSTERWGDGLFDITNQYILEGVRGGLLTLIMFVVMIAFAFRRVGLVWRECGKDSAGVFTAWALGASLFVHVTNFVGVSYFGQIQMQWYLVLAAIGSAPARGRRTQPVRKGESKIVGVGDVEALR